MAESIALDLFSRKSYKDSDGTTWVVRIPLPHVTIMDGACPSGERTHTDCTVEYRCLRSCSRNITASEIKLASVKLGMKYMKRVCSELEMIAGSPEEEELMLQGVRFAFRVHQFAGGFDVETMRAFLELRDKARCHRLQSKSHGQQKLYCRSTSCQAPTSVKVA
ncbi:hypothetical protein BHM03_00006342 [Ensete ventricosum]|nr:hypothetical protein BHM03_00006342 [Ensete ventricosum]